MHQICQSLDSDLTILDKLHIYFKSAFINEYSEHEYMLWIENICIKSVCMSQKIVKLRTCSFLVLNYIKINYSNFIQKFFTDYLVNRTKSFNLSYDIKAPLNDLGILYIPIIQSDPGANNNFNLTKITIEIQLEKRILGEANEFNETQSGLLQSLDCVQNYNKIIGYAKSKCKKGSRRTSNLNNRKHVMVDKIPTQYANISNDDDFIPCINNGSKKPNLYYTFTNFVIGNSNQMAYYSAFAIATLTSNINFGCKTPLFLYGRAGLGKTHLLYAILNYVEMNLQDKQVLYISVQEFMHGFIKSLKNKTSLEFRDQFKKVDILIIDDIQFISNKDTMQAELFNLIDNVIENGQQLIICADKSPIHLNNLQDCIKSRLSWGLVVDIQPPEHQLKLDILRLKLSEAKQILTDEILEFLASNINSSVRELESALNKILAYQTLHKKTMTLKNVKDIMKDLDYSVKVITSNDITSHVASHYGISMEELTSTIKSPKFARPRQIAMYIIKQLTKLSLLEIAKIFNKSDHTGVVHALKAVQKMIEQDHNLKDEIERIINFFT